MEPITQKILDELYAFDPALKENERSVAPLVAELMKHKPNPTINEQFVRDLRAKLMTTQTPEPVAPQTGFAKFFSTFRPLVLAGSGIALLIVVAAVAGPFQKNLSNTAGKQGNSTVVALGSGAFGSLSTGATGGKDSISARPASAENASAPSGLTPSAPPAPTSNMAYGMGAGMGGGVGIADKMSIRAPMPYTIYKYSYDAGSLPPIDGSSLVYKPNASNLASLPDSFSTSAFDLRKLQSAGLQSVTIAEDREYGYLVTIDFTQGMVSFSSNYLKWPYQKTPCADEACYRGLQLKAGDMPADDEVISKARAFLNEYGIDASRYGEPEIQNSWRVMYAQATDKSQVYIPESVTVVFPQIVDGMRVYDEGGNAVGVSVNYSARFNRVESVWNISTNSFQSSSYANETDSKKIIEIAERGGMYGGFYEDPNAKIEKIGLKTPEKVLMQTWQQNTDGSGSTLLVPAFRFILDKKPDNMYYQTAIIVPLTKDILARVQNVPPPVIYYSKPAEDIATPPTIAPEPKPMVK